MDQSSGDSAEDQDSLFGSPPPSPARGRSPSLETPAVGGESGPIVTAPSAVTGRKNVGTIALPGSHMSCAELPADLPAPSLSPTRPVSSRDSSSGVMPSNIPGASTSRHTPTMRSRSSTHSVSSGASPMASTTPAASASTKKRRKPKSKSVTPIPPITLPGPNEPTPPNFLRSQSSLLGLAGVVGCVKPAQLRTHDPKPISVYQSRTYTPIHGSTPTHPIVIDDDQEIYAPQIGKRPISQLQMPQRLDQLDPELFRSNVANSLTREKNLFPVLESLIKLLGGEPHLPSTTPPLQPFSRPYGCGVFNAQPSSTPSHPALVGSSTLTIPLPKRRKLKHVPAGAADWDVPFPFANGEGPEAYRDTWAQDRAKHLVTQLLELLQNAAKRAAIKTANTRGKVPKVERRNSASSCQSSRSASVETQIGQSSSAQPEIWGCSSYTSPNREAATTGTSVDSLSHFLGLLEAPSGDDLSASTLGPKDSTSLDLGGTVERGSSAVPDYSAFEEWLSQLQQFLPLETNTPIPESDCSTPSPITLDIPDSVQHATRDEAIDPALLTTSQQSGSAPLSPSPTSSAPTITQGDILQSSDIPPTPPALTHSPRTSLSSLAEPLTPLSEAFADPPTSIAVHQDLHKLFTDQLIEKGHIGNRVQTTLLSLTELSDPPSITAAQKGKARADSNVASATPSMSSRSTPGTVSMPKGALDKRAILERAQERRRQLVAEIERAKMEIWETTIENAVLVRFTRNESS